MKETYLYYIYDSATDSVKLGISNNIKKRLQTLQTSHGNRLMLLGYQVGNIIVERMLHLKFKHYQKSFGEWFEFSDEIQNYVNENNLMNFAVEKIDGKIFVLAKMKK